MKQFLSALLITFSTNMLLAQTYTGQWKGSFVDNSSIISWGSNKCDYVIDLDVNGTVVSGFSYTYFDEDGKKYYTICKLKGTLNKKKKYIEVTETERTKTNVPREVINSFQLHKLRWRREAGKEILEGNWEPAPGQDRRNTGFGTTLLTKRQLTEISPLAKKLNSKNSPFASPQVKKEALITPKKKAPLATAKPLTKKPITPASKPIVKNNSNNKIPKKVAPPMATTTPKKLPNKEVELIKKDSGEKQLPITKIILPKEKIKLSDFEKRSNTVLQTVNVENAVVNIEIYDNGEIDGDSISLFYNGKVLLAHKMLTTQPIKLDLPINNDAVNELVMYADNLGTIPPNTALMIVMDGNKRYEVRITSDLSKSGTIRFVHAKKQ